MDLSVLIPARHEQFLAQTVADVLKNARAETEVIVVADGEWPVEALEQHPRVQMLHFPQSIGQRAATNMAARLSQATYVMKLDAHCMVAEGFDVALIEADKELGRPDVTQIPAMKNLHAFDWKCKGCGYQTYQGPVLESCTRCKENHGFEQVVTWKPRRGTTTDSWRFDHTVHFQYWKRHTEGDLVDVMSSIGACFFMRRERFFELGGLDEAHGSWGSFGVEIACKSWLSGGRQIVNKRTWFAHLFRTRRDFSFPYPISGNDQERAREYSRKLWNGNRWEGQTLPLSWLIEKFAPLPGWHDPDGAEALAKVTEAGAVFRAAHGLAGGADALATRSLDEGDVSTATCVQSHSVGVDGVSNDFQMGRVGAVAPLAQMVELGVGLDQNGRHEPRVHEPMDADLLLAKEEQAVAGVVQSTVVDPAAGVLVNRDLAEQAAQAPSVNVWNCEKLGDSHDSASYAVRRSEPSARYQRVGGSPILTKGLCYYTDNRIDPSIGDPVRAILKDTGLPIVSVSLKPLSGFGLNIVLPLERGYLAMFKQILAGLEALDTDIAFLVEHDVAYHPSHFRFTPARMDTYYYNQHVYKVDAESGRALHYKCNQTSGLCANRQLLVDHYRARVARVEAEGFTRAMGFEPGTRKIRHGGIDDVRYESWMSEAPNVDIRHGVNLTPSRWKKEDFRNQKYTEGWTEADAVPGWGVTAGRFSDFLKEVTCAPL